MSRSPDVAVIGGGIIGCSSAAILAERGATVTLFEATAIGAGASGRNLGAIQHPFDAVLAPLYHASLEAYYALAAQDEGFAMPARPAGVLMLNRDPDASRRQVEHLRGTAPDLDVEFVDADAVAAAEPSLVPGFVACRLETGYPSHQPRRPRHSPASPHSAARRSASGSKPSRGSRTAASGESRWRMARGRRRAVC